MNTRPAPCNGPNGATLRARCALAPVGVAPTRLRDLVRARTRELAVLAGRDPLDVTQDDYEQAKREVTGEAEPDRQVALLDADFRPDEYPHPTFAAHDPPGAAAPPVRNHRGP